MENKFDSNYFITHKDEKVRELWKSFEKMTKGVEGEMYFALRLTIRNLNSQLVDSNKKVDLFGDEKDKSFDRAHKYTTEMSFYIKSLKELEKFITPDELQDIDKRIDETRTVAELMNEIKLK